MSEAFNFSKFKGMIHQITKETFSLINHSIPEEDLYQIFNLCYVKALEIYDSGGILDFDSYLFRTLSNKKKKLWNEYMRGNLSREGASFSSPALSDNRYAPVPSVKCIFCHSKDKECYLDQKAEISSWKTSCPHSPKTSFECEKWIEYRYDRYAEEFPLNEEIEYEDEPPTEDISILMADCTKHLNEREMRIVRQILDSPEGHFDFVAFCEEEGVSHTVIARALESLKEKMKTILGKEE